MVIRAMWGKCVGSGLGEGREEVVILRGNDVVEVLDIVRRVWERGRKFGEEGRCWVVGSCRLDCGIRGKVTERVSKGRSAGRGSGKSGSASERCGAYDFGVWRVEEEGFGAGN